MLYGRALDGGAFGRALEACGLARGHSVSHAPQVGFRSIEVGPKLLDAVDVFVDSLEEPRSSKRRIVFVASCPLCGNA